MLIYVSEVPKQLSGPEKVKFIFALLIGGVIKIEPNMFAFYWRRAGREGLR